MTQAEAEAFYGKEKDMNKTPMPLGKRVMLVKDEAPETSEGGIVIPDNAREKPLTARVIAVGDGCSTISNVGHRTTVLSPGDEVIFASFAGTEFTIDGREVIVVDEEDIMLVLQEVPTLSTDDYATDMGKDIEKAFGRVPSDD